jgi:hypothetical protein
MRQIKELLIACWSISLSSSQQIRRHLDHALAAPGGTSHLALERATKSHFSLADRDWPKWIFIGIPPQTGLTKKETAGFQSGHDLVAETPVQVVKQHDQV